MRYLIIYMDGKEDRFYAVSFIEFQQLLEQSMRRNGGRFDLIYCLGYGR